MVNLLKKLINHFRKPKRDLTLRELLEIPDLEDSVGAYLWHQDRGDS